MPKLAEGLYEELLTERLADRVATTVAPPTGVRADLRDVSEIDLPQLLAKALAHEIERALRDAPDAAGQVAIAEEVLSAVAKVAPSLDARAAALAAPPRLLTAIYRNAPPARPSTPLATSTLLTRNRAEPALGHEIGREIDSSDAVDLLAAFITMGGVRVVRDPLERLVRRGGRLRVLTTVFTGTTEVAALDALARLPNVEVRISYDVQRTRLHAKAWLFERATTLHSAYIGSANLTKTALGSGHEWMVKVCAADLPHVIDKFQGTFKGLWNDSEFERYDPTSDVDRARLTSALTTEQGGAGGAGDVTHLFALRPFPFQEEILDRLSAERQLYGRHRNLVVSATGTGKTVVAAFDYARRVASAGVAPRLLFLAHRKEILEQARHTFRNVLHDGAFGEMWCDGDVPARWDHVFATVQSAAASLGASFTAGHFNHVVMDECHHAPADSYQRVLAFLTPETLVGLTATPERSDGRSLLPDFDGRVAVELRLWNALERQLLVPFEYYGVADGTDLTHVKWSPKGYAAADLAHVYTGNHARVDLIVHQLQRRVLSVRSIRAIAFCVSVEHAEFMARELTARGVPAVAVHGGTESTARREAPSKLRERTVNVLCTCDLYNEGIDLPFVDTLLLLRPTASATLFLQQLGRGLRLHSEKSSCLVLDFIGQHRAEFRFDGILAALTNVPRGALVAAVNDGFPFLPSGCALELDAVARQRVLDALKRVIPTRDKLAQEVREHAGLAALSERERPTITLAQFLERSGRDLDDVYRDGSAGQGWSTLLARAGLTGELADASADLSRRLGWLCHVDERARLHAWTDALVAPPPAASALAARRLTMLDFQLHHRGVLRAPDETAAYLAHDPQIALEIRELVDVLDARITISTPRYPVAEWPLALHHHYSRREIMAAVGFVEPGKKGKTPQGGIVKLEAERREILLVTLDKSGTSFSPTTRYRDYAISPTRFHWETQASASEARPSGRRYLDSAQANGPAANGWTFYLFVRQTPTDAAEYAFLGPVRLASHTGDRPIAITWELTFAMSPALFERFATLAQG